MGEITVIAVERRRPFGAASGGDAALGNKRSEPMADVEIRIQEILSKLRECKYKVTPQRVAIIKILADSKGHPSVEEIFERLQKDFPGTSMATVYRTIMLVKSMGEALELRFADGSNRYDGSKPYPHPHVVCTRCNKIIDLQASNLKAMARQVTEETGFRIETYRLDFFGVCAKCQNNT
jgi:Fur family peroxide stress response transcriptional regulator